MQPFGYVVACGSFPEALLATGPFNIPLYFISLFAE